MGNFDTEIPFVTFEPGHRVIKIGATDRESVAHFDHDVIEIDSARYEYLKSRENGVARYDAVSVGGLYFITGERAYNEKQGQVENRRDLRKYEQPYITALLVSGLLRLYNGNIPPRINIMIAHPPLLYNDITTIRRSVLGTTRYSYIGGKGQFTIEYSEPYDEVVAGCMNILLNPYGQPYDRETFDIDVTSGRWLFYDLGGGTLDLGQLRDGLPVYDNIISHDVGGNDAITTFCSLVSKNHKGLVSQTKDRKFPRDIAYEVLMNSNLSLEHFGSVYDLRDEFDEAFTPLVRSSQRYVTDYTNGWLGYKGVIAIGGVCGVLYNQLEDMVFAGFKGDTKGKKPRIKPVEENISEMFLGNIRGAGRWARAKVGIHNELVKPVRRRK
jgi:hypothetical protein